MYEITKFVQQTGLSMGTEIRSNFFQVGLQLFQKCDGGITEAFILFFRVLEQAVKNLDKFLVKLGAGLS